MHNNSFANGILKSENTFLLLFCHRILFMTSLVSARFSVIICKSLFLPHLIFQKAEKWWISFYFRWLHLFLTFWHLLFRSSSHVIHWIFFFFKNIALGIFSQQPALTSQWSFPAFDLHKSNLFHLQSFHVVINLYVLGERTNTEHV